MNTEHRATCVDGNVCGESAHCPPVDELANARDAFGVAIDAYRAVAAILVRVRAVVDEYGDDFEPEDGWRYTRDLLAALDPKGTDEPPE